MLWYGHKYDNNLCKQFGSRSCPIKMLGLIWIQSDTLMHENRIIFFIEISINPYKPSVLSFFVGHRQTVQTQIRRQITWRLIRVSTVCLQNVLFKFNEKCHPTKLNRKWTCPIDRGGNHSISLLMISKKCISEGRVQSHQSLSVPIAIIRKLYMCNLTFFTINNPLEHSDIPLCRDQRSDKNLKNDTYQSVHLS